MSTGEIIKKLRKEKGLSQKQLADRLGTTQQNLAQYENNKRKPKPATLQKIANALNVSIYEFTKYEHPLSGTEIIAHITSTEEKHQLMINIIRNMGYVVQFSGCPSQASLCTYDEEKKGFWTESKFITSCQFGKNCETCKRRSITYYEISKGGKSVRINIFAMRGFFTMIESDIDKLLTSIFEHGDI